MKLLIVKKYVQRTKRNESCEGDIFLQILDKAA